MPNSVARKTAGASSQLINDWKCPLANAVRPVAVSMVYLRQSGFVGSFRAGFQCLDQADAVLGTVWGQTVNNASPVTDSGWQSYSAINLTPIAGAFFARFVIEVGVSGNTAHSAGTVSFDTTDLQQSLLTHLDDLLDGPLYGKVNNTILSAGDVYKIKRSPGIYVEGSDVFDITVDSLDQILNGSTFNKVSVRSVNGLGEVTSFADGFTLRTMQDADGGHLNTIATSLSGITAEMAGTVWKLAINGSTTDPHLNSGLRYMSGATHAVLRYQFVGSWPASSYTAMLRGLTSSSTASATIYADGATRTAIFQLSGFTAGEYIQLHPIESGLPLGAAYELKVMQLSLGTPGVGSILSTVDDVTFDTDWSNYGSPWEDVQYYRDPVGIITLHGTALRSTGAGTRVFTLPLGTRPVARQIFSVPAEYGTARVDVYPNGEVHIPYGVGDEEWASFSGVAFRT